MPDFTFTSPQGKQYTVTGPDGSTKEQAFAVLQQQLSAGTAVEDQQPSAQAVQPKQSALDRFKSNLQSENPLNKLGAEDKPVPPPTLRSAASAIASNTAFGGVVGALSPEIVMGLGAAVTALPYVGEVAGPALVATGEAMRAGRLSAAAQGALGGATSEVAGQAVEAAGGTKGEATAARLVGGLGPGAASSVGRAISRHVPDALRVPWQAVQRIAGVTPEGGAAVKAAKENLAKIEDMGKPQTALHAMLQKGVEADRQAAGKAADAVMAEAHANAARVAQSDTEAANRIVEDARTRAEAIRAEAAQRANVLDKASGGKMATASRVLAKAAPELAKVGTVRELSDIGNEVRQAATVKQGAEIEARNNAYKAAVQERDAIVAQKQAQGQSIDDTPSIVALKKDLARRLGKVGGFEQTVEPGVRRGLQQVQDAITRRPSATGMVDANGQPVVDQAKTSFEALDHVRRRLGDVIAGREAEGYEAIGKQAAQRMYAQISKAQEEFVGEAGGRNIQRELQSQYAEGSEGLVKYGSKAGQKATALDRVDPERFANDPKSLPGHFFSSQQGVRDLRELTGNPQLVNRMAADYSARSMQGMSAKQAAGWVQSNSDWLREVPGLQANARAYANKLAQIERVSGGLEKRAGALAKEAGTVRETGTAAAEAERQAGVARASNVAEQATKTQARMAEEGQKAAAAKAEEAFAPSKALGKTLEGAEAPKAVRNLLLHGSPAETRAAARHLAGTPGGREVLDSSVRQVMRDMNEQSLRQNWHEQILPMLREGKMMSPERLKMLEQDVGRVLAAYGGKDKVGMVRRYIAGALGGAGSAMRGQYQGNGNN